MDLISSRITEIEFPDNGRVFVAPTGAKDVVTIMGSVLGGIHMLPTNKSEVAVLAAELLDAGTKGKSKNVIRGTLAEKGAGLWFSTGGDRMYFNGSCLPEDLGTVLFIAAECLGWSTFPATEFTTTQKRILDEVTESKTETRAQAYIAFSELIYDSKHVNYANQIDTRLQEIKRTTQGEVKTFAKMLGRGGLVLALAGDVDAKSAQKALAVSFAKLPTGTSQAPVKERNTKKQTVQEKRIVIPDKATIDVYLGSALPFVKQDPIYIPFTIVLQMLGGRGLGSGHLMLTVRERDGLTYGINASAGGFEYGADGFFNIWATFSPDTFDLAVNTTKKEVAYFLSNKLTEAELTKKKDRIVGSHLVGLATTSGIAGMLHQIGTMNKPLSYIDSYLDLVRNTTLKQLKEAAEYIDLKKMSLAAAGTFAK